MANLKSGCVLVVEDDIEIRETLIDLLQDEGYEVASAENGSVALNILRATEVLPALILLDISMPVMDGYEFRVEQVKDQRLANIPAAVVSADGLIEEKAKRIGLKEYLKKPIDLDELFRLVAKHCRC